MSAGDLQRASHEPSIFTVITLAVFGFLIVAGAAAQTTDGKSLDEVNKELSNPISSIWALQLQENTYWLNKPERNVVNLQFQPVLPLVLTNDWNLITRPVFQVMNSSPYDIGWQNWTEFGVPGWHHDADHSKDGQRQSPFLEHVADRDRPTISVC